MKKQLIPFRVDDELGEYLNKLKKKTGKSRSECIRQILNASMKGSKANLESKEIFLQRKELINEINKIGTNINQIVYNNNSHFYVAYEKEKLFALMNKITELLDSKL